jgi:hypothetical protein
MPYSFIVPNSLRLIGTARILTPPASTEQKNYQLKSLPSNVLSLNVSFCMDTHLTLKTAGIVLIHLEITSN